jgi:hypothetical protein
MIGLFDLSTTPFFIVKTVSIIGQYNIVHIVHIAYSCVVKPGHIFPQLSLQVFALLYGDILWMSEKMN